MVTLILSFSLSGCILSSFNGNAFDLSRSSGITAGRSRVTDQLGLAEARSARSRGIIWHVPLRFFDILTPPYNPCGGRNCNYFEVSVDSHRRGVPSWCVGVGFGGGAMQSDVVSGDRNAPGLTAEVLAGAISSSLSSIRSLAWLLGMNRDHDSRIEEVEHCSMLSSRRGHESK